MDDLIAGPTFEDGMLPCPFCGGTPTLWPGTNPKSGNTVSPYCEGCGSTFVGGALSDSDVDEDGFFFDARRAVEYWNKRATHNALGNRLPATGAAKEGEEG